MLEALSRSDPGPRANAAYALASIGDPRSQRALQRALDDTDPTVRAWAAEGIRRIHAARLAPGQVEQSNIGATANTTLRVPLPEGWLLKESLTLLRSDGTANVIASTEPVDRGLDSNGYAAAQREMMTDEFAGYRRRRMSRRRWFGDRPGFLHEFEWSPPDGEPVTQFQIYYAKGGRG